MRQNHQKPPRSTIDSQEVTEERDIGAYPPPATTEEKSRDFSSFFSQMSVTYETNWVCGGLDKVHLDIEVPDIACKFRKKHYLCISTLNK